MIEDTIRGGWRSKPRPETFIFACRQLIKGWTVVDRLDEINVPTLVMAGRDDFVFPPECQEELAAGIPGALLRIIEGAGHNPHEEQRAEVMEAVSEFLPQSATAQVRR
jgi:proline iminopeptidase